LKTRGNDQGNRELRDRARRHGDQPMDETGRDPYQTHGKLSGPTGCSECGAVYNDGRWQWMPGSQTVAKTVCPACRRIHDRFPAGFITLSGPFLLGHREEILNLMRQEEQREKAEHPLQRIIRIEEEGDQTLVTTTDLRIAQRLGEAIHQAFHGKLEVKFAPHEYRVRINWHR
jgi:hypothetical protein